MSEREDYDDDYDSGDLEIELSASDVLEMFKQLRGIGSIDENGNVVDDGAVIVVDYNGFVVHVNEH